MNNDSITKFENGYLNLFGSLPNKDVIRGYDVTKDILLRVLIDKNLNIVHEWNTTTDCNYTVLLKKNGNLVRGTKYSGNILNGAADGGRVQELAPDGSIVWDFIYSDANHLSHQLGSYSYPPLIFWQVQKSFSHQKNLQALHLF